MKFETVKHAIGWAVARRRPGLVQVDVDERVQTTAQTGDGWVASAIYAAMRRAGIDPHGELAHLLEDWATKPSDAVDEADEAAAALAEADASDREVARARRVAQDRAALVRRTVEVLRAELERAELLQEQARVETTRARYVDAEGRIRTCRRTRAATADEVRQTAELDEVAAAAFVGPLQPPRTLDGARLVFEGDALALGSGRACSCARTMRELDRLIAAWAGCSERSARSARLGWGAVGQAGRRG